LPQTLDELIGRRSAFLTAYQDPAYASRYQALVTQARAAEARVAAGSTRLAEAVARGYFKLLAVKDEYEVARLYAETDFLARIGETFEGDYRLHFHLAPPWLARPDPKTGRIGKQAFGPWMMTAFKWLARARRWRGSAWDPFARLPERRLERQLTTDYETDLPRVLATLSPAGLEAAIELAALPETLHGFGHVKARAAAAADRRRTELLATLAGHS
jgi:indolepyruvate ferredoxin oxidoreductase